LVAHFDVPLSEYRITPAKLLLALNAHLARRRLVWQVRRALPTFHARGSTPRKQYRYYVWNAAATNPLLRHQAWQVTRALNVAAMRQAARLFVGTHDFRAFTANRGVPLEDAVRTVTRCDLRRSGALLTFIIEGTGFLYKMCRAMVGTLVQLGQGKLDEGDLRRILESRDRRMAGMTAPAHGLVLWKVRGKAGAGGEPAASSPAAAALMRNPAAPVEGPIAGSQCPITTLITDSRRLITDHPHAHLHAHCSVEPEIALTRAMSPLCAATRTILHLVEPLGFRLMTPNCIEPMDYWRHVQWHRWSDWPACERALAHGARCWFVEQGPNTMPKRVMDPGRARVWSRNRRTSRPWLEANRDRWLRLPMFNLAARSLNLANCAAIVLYEALRQGGCRSADAQASSCRLIPELARFARRIALPTPGHALTVGHDTESDRVGDPMVCRSRCGWRMGRNIERRIATTFPPKGTFVTVYDDEEHFFVLRLLTMTGLASTAAASHNGDETERSSFRAVQR
jgi:tRNA pseudouridine38-40 synthase